MSVQSQPRLTPEEYLEHERQAEYKSEYCNGEVFATAGARRRHNLVASNVAGELRSHLKGRPCEVYVGDMRTKVSATGLYTYPDVVVACKEILFEDEEDDVLLNPTVIVEVLSRSTEAYDRGDKFAHYRRLESLMDYLLVCQDQKRVDHYTRLPDDKWLLSEWTHSEEAVHLPSLECMLALSEVYDKVDFSTGTGLAVHSEEKA